MAEYSITNTNQARNCASSLKEDAQFYTQVVQQLEEARTQIVNNWEGDTSDINAICTEILNVSNTFSAKIIPALVNLNTGVTNFADEVDKTASETVDNNSGSSSKSSSGSTSASSGGESGKVGFWEYHGNDFANDWDYSGCDSGLDYVGATVSGLCGTVGSAANFVVDGASEIVGWLFG